MSQSALAASAEAASPTLKDRQRAAWSSGDYAVIGTTLQIVGETLCEAVDLRAGQQVIDVAAGNGNASLAAARRWCDVTATDYVPSLLDRARDRAQAEGLSIALREADAEALPFAAESFDVVLSTFGVMFTPDQERAANELVRVCRPGGKIGLANWTPDSFVGHLFKTIATYLPPPPHVKPPSRWGTQAGIVGLFGAHDVEITATPRSFAFRYVSAEHWLAVFRAYYGPIHKAFAALPIDQQGALERDLLAVARQFNVANDGTLVAPSEYLEVVLTRR